MDFSSIFDNFTVKIASKEEVLDGNEDFPNFNDINVVWVFTFNSNRQFSIFEFSIVTFLLILSAVITIIGIFCAGMSNFPHRNHRLLVIAGIFCWFELLISRCLVFYYQCDKRLSNSADEPSVSKILFWAAFFRYHYVFFGIHSVLSVTVERALATYFISDYEKKSRIWIPLLLIFSNFCFSTAYSLLAAYQFIKMKLMFLDTLITVLSAIILLEIVFYKNRKRLETLNLNLKYTLSTRYQLEENVKSCKLVRAAVITVGTLIILLILTECLPVILDFPDDVRKWCNLIFDTTAHINPIIIVPSITYLIDGSRRVFIDFFCLKTRRFLKIVDSSAFSRSEGRRKSIFSFSGNMKNARNGETVGDIYFAMFDKSVNSGR